MRRDSKSPWPQGRAGSSPAAGTKLFKKLAAMLLLARESVTLNMSEHTKVSPIDHHQVKDFIEGFLNDE